MLERPRPGMHPLRTPLGRVLLGLVVVIAAAALAGVDIVAWFCAVAVIGLLAAAYAPGARRR